MTAGSPATGGRDRFAIGLAVGATVLSTTASIGVFRSGEMLSATSSVVTMLVTRRLADAGPSELGGLLPLPHVLMMPMAVLDRLTETGLAGAAVSMAAYVLCCLLLYRITSHLLRDRPAPVGILAGLAAAGVFGLNPNVLHLQSTPATEPPLYAALLGTVYFLQRWVTRPHDYGNLVRAGLCALLGSLTGYQMWLLLPVLGGLVLLGVLHRDRRKSRSVRRRRAEDVLLVFLPVTFAGVTAWLAWNWLVFRDPLTFWAGWNPAAVDLPPGIEPVTWNGDGTPAALGRDVLSAVGAPLVLAALLGAGLLAVAGRRARRSVEVAAVLIPLVLGPVCGYLIDDGIRLLRTGSGPNAAQDVLAGLGAVLPVAVLVGYLAGRVATVGRLPWSRAATPTAAPGAVPAGAVGAVLLVGALAFAVARPVAPWREPADAPAADRMSDQRALSGSFASLYDGGDVLMATAGNERLALLAVPPDALIDENFADNGRWLDALADPAAVPVTWIVMRCGRQAHYGSDPRRSDNVCVAFTERPQALAGYDLAHQHTGESLYRIYRMRG
nr:hypothetical protein [Micromonospora sp. DSM 115978]